VSNIYTMRNRMKGQYETLCIKETSQSDFWEKMDSNPEYAKRIEKMCGKMEKPDFYEKDGEIDCSHPYLTHIEPLPSGVYPPSLITTGNSYWECGTDKAYLHADGTFTGTMSASIDISLEAWEACGIGPRPPAIMGNWVYLQDYSTFCLRYNNLPGVISCVGTVLESGGVSTFGGMWQIFQYGRQVDTNTMTCHLRN